MKQTKKQKTTEDFQLPTSIANLWIRTFSTKSSFR